MEKKISEKQFVRLLQKGSTVNLKGFKIDSKTTEGRLKFNENFKLQLEQKLVAATTKSNEAQCPKCNKGNIVKNKNYYGCTSNEKDCNFKISYALVKEKINGRKPTKELVYKILTDSI